MESIYDCLPDIQPSWGGRGGQKWGCNCECDIGGCWNLEVKWTFQEHTITNVPISQILLAPSFLWMRVDALRRCLSLKQSSNPPSTICLYISIPDPKYKLLLRKAPQKKPQDSNSVHPPQTLHTVSRLAVSLSQSPGPSKPKATWRLYQELASLPLTNSDEELMCTNWGGGHLCWALLA